MEGTKAIWLEEFARQNGRRFLRFDYSGHGSSSGGFLDGCIGDWAQDAQDVISAVTDGPQIFVGSSMGGWIALLLAREIPERVAGLVGIAAAPDFTEDSMWGGFDDRQKQIVLEEGQIELPSEYDDSPYIITKRLIEDGRRQLVLRSALSLPFPVRLLHGTADVDVAQSVPLRLMSHTTADDMHLTLVKDADHRFSNPENLALIGDTIEDVIRACV